VTNAMSDAVPPPITTAMESFKVQGVLVGRRSPEPKKVKGG